MKRKIVLFTFLLLLTGCTSEYNITISNDKIKENIVVNIPDNYIPVQTDIENNDHIEIDDQVTPFIEEDQYPFLNNNDIKYDKKVVKNGNITNVTLDYTYTLDDYKKSKAFTTCFDKKSFTKTNKGYQINLTGSFYCLYGDEVKINIKTNNEVLKNNADKVKGNVYTWIINKDNSQKVDIAMELSKKPAIIKKVIIGVLIIIFVIALGFGYNAYQKIKNRESINDI